MSLRILQIMPRVPWPLKDGGAFGFYNATQGYYDAGCDVTVCALNTNKHYFDIHQLPDKVKAIADWRAVNINTDINPLAAFLNLFTNKSYNISRFISREFEQLIRDTLSEKQFDVIVFESIYVASCLSVVCNNSKALKVLRQYNAEHHIWETLALNEKQFFKKWYLNLLAKRIKKYEQQQLNEFDMLTTVTLQDADVFIKMGCKKPIFVTPVGLSNMQDSVSLSVSEDNSIFHLGSMEWLPNQQAMLWFLHEVWDRVVQQMPEAKFYLAGRAMPDLFKQLNLPNVHVIGEVPRADVFMQSKQIMVVPLFAGSGIRVKILEGMLFGKTIVSTALGVQGIECDNGKHLMIANNADEFVEVLVSLLKDKKRCTELGQNAGKWVRENYDNAKVISKLLSVYRQQIALLTAKRQHDIHT